MTIQLSSLSNHEVTAKIVTLLKAKLGNFPHTGVLAGQAVASAFFELYGMGEAPYNDLDVFLQEKNSHIVEEKVVGYTDDGHKIIDSKVTYGLLKTTTNTKTELCATSGGCISEMPVDSNGYYIKKSTRDNANPDINFIYVSFAKTKDDEVNYPLSIIKGFDINCVQIAIDLQTMELVWTDEFQDFLYSKKIQVSFWGTPMHTAVRLLKKQDDVSFATLDVDTEMHKLQSIRHVGAHLEQVKLEKGKSPFFSGNIFSAVYRDRFIAKQDVLSRYFIMKEEVLTFTRERLIRRSNSHSGQMHWEESTDTVWRLYPVNYDSKKADHFCKYFFSEKRAPEEAYPERIETVNGLFPQWYRYLDSPKSTKQLDILVATFPSNSSADRYFMNNALVSENKLLKRFNDVELNRASKAYNQHTNLLKNASPDADAEFGIHYLVENAKFINYLQKVNHAIYIGLIEEALCYHESKGFDIYDSLIDDLKKVYINPYSNTLKQDVAKSVDEYMTVLKKTSSLPKFTNNIIEDVLADFDGAFIVELNSRFALYVEGITMRHCVGGYFESIKNQRSMIFSINTNPNSSENMMETRSTLEIASPYGRRPEIIQQRTRFNEDVTETHKDIADALLKAIITQIESIQSNNSEHPYDDDLHEHRFATCKSPNVTTANIESEGYDDEFLDDIPF